MIQGLTTVLAHACNVCDIRICACGVHSIDLSLFLRLTSGFSCLNTRKDTNLDMIQGYDTLCSVACPLYHFVFISGD